MSIIGKFQSATFLVMAIFNMLGGVVGIVWLLFTGEWIIVIYGIIASIVFLFVYSIPTMVVVPLMALSARYIEKQKSILAGVSMFIGMLIDHVLGLVWIYSVFIFIASAAEGNDIIPYLLLGWLVTMTPFQYMASKEPDPGIGTQLGPMFFQISYILLIIFHLANANFLAIPILLVFMLLYETYLLKSAFRTIKQTDSFDN